jgi:hypothetical protein
MASWRTVEGGKVNQGTRHAALNSLRCDGCDAEVKIKAGPADALSIAEQVPSPTLPVGRVEELRKPRQRDSDRAAVRVTIVSSGGGTCESRRSTMMTRR